MTYQLLGVIHLILFVIALVDILKSGMSPVNKLLWILLILLLPVIGLVLYFLLGRK